MLHYGRRRWFAIAAIGVAVIGLCPAVSRGQINESWVVFIDSQSDSECGVINTANAELILLIESNQLAIVSGIDGVVDGAFVNESDEVTYQGTPAGFLEYLTDGDGFRSMFWTTLTGNMVEVDSFTGEPFDSGLLPGERINAGCDGCEFVDNHPDCPETVIVPRLFCGAGVPGAVVVSALLIPIARLPSTRRQSR